MISFACPCAFAGGRGGSGSSSGCARPLAPPPFQSYPDLGILFLARVICPVLKQSKVQFVNPDQLLFYGDALGPDQGLFGSALGQVGASARSSAAFPQLPLPSRRQAVVLTGLLLPFTMQLFFQR